MLIDDLKGIELENDAHLDDDSIRFIGKIHDSNLLRGGETTQIKDFLREALRFLKEPDTSSKDETTGMSVIDMDADPRNANWLRIDRANRLAGHVLPMWAAFWLWQLRRDSSLKFWNSVGNIAKELGYERFVPRGDSQN